MSSILLSIPELFDSYKSWVQKNPHVLSEYETTTKWISYFIAGRIHNSHIVSELVYCLSNLLVLFNDGIIRTNLELRVESNVQKLKLWLTVIEYSEVFCELSVQKLWGKTAKWIVVVAIQIFKCVAKLLLVYKYKENIIENPVISPLERQKLTKDGKAIKPNWTDLGQGDLNSVAFTLKSSGRIMRRVECSPPLNLRSWKPLSIERENLKEANNSATNILIKKHLVAETIYISKPLMHLLSMGMFGSDNWKPWLISLAMDITSLHLYKATEKSKLSKTQKLQLSKRTVLLLLYLLRSPFYEKHSKDRINSSVNSICNNIPFVKFIGHPLLQYLPFLQSCYFHMWSN